MRIFAKKDFRLKDADWWFIKANGDERIPAFVVNYNVKAPTIPAGFFRYYGRITDGVLWDLRSTKNRFVCYKEKEFVCIITMEPIKYSWKQGMFMYKGTFQTSKKAIKKCIKKRYGKAALDAFCFELNKFTH